VVDEDLTAFGGKVFGHIVEMLTIDVEGNTVRGPIESVLVEFLVWAEG
jgi:hypothetical protein